MGKDILARTRELLQNDDSLTDPNNCRNSVHKLSEILKNEYPKENVTIVVYPDARKGLGVHYAIGTRDKLINPVSAPGFPEYIGPREEAGAIFQLLKPTDKVI